jgi:hypothetical protein
MYVCFVGYFWRFDLFAINRKSGWMGVVKWMLDERGWGCRWPSITVPLGRSLTVERPIEMRGGQISIGRTGVWVRIPGGWRLTLPKTREDKSELLRGRRRARKARVSCGQTREYCLDFAHYTSSTHGWESERGIDEILTFAVRCCVVTIHRV